MPMPMSTRTMLWTSAQESSLPPCLVTTTFSSTGWWRRATRRGWSWWPTTGCSPTCTTRTTRGTTKDLPCLASLLLQICRFDQIQYWHYQAGQEISACKFHKKKLTVTLLVEGVKLERILTMEKSYLGHFAKNQNQNFDCSSSDIGVLILGKFFMEKSTLRKCLFT